jgi:tetratricopeptide (TPR) repeat protein/predicted Ser/Thr protein kinase
MSSPSSGASHEDVTQRPAPSLDDTLRSGGGPEPRSLPAGVQRGTAIGRFVVLDRLGLGGMGVVYSAFDPELDRKVALKLVLAGQPSTGGSSRARLLREAQSMAQVSHPNVAAIYDVGTTDDGIYIAMEYIDGFTLTDWLAVTRRGWQEIVEVFVAAARGIEAAHAAGLIHRDLKPDNLMIGRDGRVRVLDFGLARANTGPRSSESNEALPATSSGSWSPASSLELHLTAPGHVMGTPMYMAPEQHAGKPVDARCDVYSFCVALWEAVYRQRPFGGRSIAEIATNVLSGRIVEPAGVKIPGWLRATLLRGLAADPDKRIPDMRTLIAELSQDRSRRARRIVVAGAVVAAVAGGVVVTRYVVGVAAPCDDAKAVLAGVWDAERRDEIEAAFDAENKSYVDATWTNVERSLDGYANAIVAMRTEACEATRIHGTQSDELLGRRMACLDRRVRRLGALTSTLANGGAETVQRAVEATDGLPDLAPCADAERLMQGVAPPEDAATRELVEEIRGELEETKSFAVAGHIADLAERSADILARARATEYAPLIAEALLARGNYDVNLGQNDAALEHLGDALELAEAHGHDPVIAEASIVLVLAEGRGRSRFDVADVYARRAGAVLDRMGGEPRLRMLLLSHVGMIENIRGRYAESLVALEAALAIAEELGKGSSPSVLPILNSMSVALLENDRPQDADAVVQRALTIIETQVGLSHPNAGVVFANQARMRDREHEYEEAVALWQRSREVFIASLGPDHPNVGAVSNGEGLALVALGRDADAAVAFDRAQEIVSRASGKDHLNVAGALVNLGAAQTRLGRPELAIATLRRALEIKTARLGVDHEDVAYVSDLLGDALLASGDTALARASYERSLEVMQKLGGADDPRTAYPRTGLGQVARAVGDLELARSHLEKALAVQAADVPKMQRGDTRFELAQALADSDPKRARQLAAEAIVAYREAGARGRVRLAAAQAWLDAHAVDERPR